MTDPITDLSAAVRAEGALPMPAGSVRLTAEREAEIRERAPKRTAEFTAWLNKYSPMPGGDAANHAETVLEEDVPALLAELDAVRAERDQAQKRASRAIWALKSPAPPGSEHYRSGWDDGLEAAIDAIRDALGGGAS